MYEMLGKSNMKAKQCWSGRKVNRFSLKKLSVGLVSVAVSSSLFFFNSQRIEAKESENTIEETTVTDRFLEKDTDSADLTPEETFFTSEGIENSKTMEDPKSESKVREKDLYTQKELDNPDREFHEDVNLETKLDQNSQFYQAGQEELKAENTKETKTDQNDTIGEFHLTNDKTDEEEGLGEKKIEEKDPTLTASHAQKEDNINDSKQIIQFSSEEDKSDHNDMIKGCMVAKDDLQDIYKTLPAHTTVTKDKEAPVPLLGDQHRILSLDAGRRYFTIDQIKQVLDTMNSQGYSDFQLLVGNDGFRFLLDDMTLEVNGVIYQSDDVKKAFIKANKDYYDDPQGNYLTETEMDEILQYAKDRNINVIPGINGPGHAYSIIKAMEYLGIDEPGHIINGEESKSTINLKNSQAYGFNSALLEKYLAYFEGKVNLFNLGLDEFANDLSSGGGPQWGALQESGEYKLFIDYVNSMSQLVKSYGLRPMGYNDGIYYDYNTDYGQFDTDLVISYWVAGWQGMDLASAQFLAEQGFTLLNSNDNFYYVIGHEAKGDGVYEFETLLERLNNTEFDQFSTIDGRDEAFLNSIGTMAHIWSDDPQVNQMNFDNVIRHINMFAEEFDDIFTDDLKNTYRIVIEDQPGEDDPSREQGYLTKWEAEIAAKSALENDKINNSYKINQGEDGLWYYVLSPVLPEDFDDDEDYPTIEGELSVDSVYDFLEPVFEWNIDYEEDKDYPTIEGETSVDSVYDFLAPSFDWSGLEEAVAEEEVAKEDSKYPIEGKSSLDSVYDFLAPDFEWNIGYEEEDSTSPSSVEDPDQDKDDDKPDGSQVPGSDAKGSQDGQDQSKPVDIQETPKAGQQAVEGPDKASTRAVSKETGSKGASRVKDNKALDYLLQNSKEEKAPSKKVQTGSASQAKDAKDRETLPDTASSGWALGAIGLSAFLSGLGLHKFKKED